jgi:hypothetical protein
MFAHRTLHWFAFAQLVSGAISVPGLASQASDAFSIIVTTPASPVVVMVTGRKGTRNYVPDDAEASDDAETSADAKENAAQPEEAAKDRLDQCLASWDKGTHITQNTWHQICERQIKANE